MEMALASLAGLGQSSTGVTVYVDLVLQNPQASAPLRVQTDVVCNTPQEKILANVLANSKSVSEWVKWEDANNTKILLCGSGPSIEDDIELIRALQEEGAQIWALNNCANYLASFGILADVQVIMDAQPRTIELLGPAKRHLFASQCDPSLFAAVPTAQLWHSTYGNFPVDEQEGFPSHSDYCLIGAGVSVGNTAMVLAYALGCRNLHLFGFDSSHKEGKGHVQHQSMNDGDPCTVVEFRGKEYVCSLSMRLQAENFHARAKALQEAGCIIIVHGHGLLPDQWNADMTEEEKYSEIWKHLTYRTVSPGEELAVKFLEIVRPQRNSRIADFGCGTGRGGLAISKLIQCQMTLVDFTTNSRDEEAQGLPFIKHDLTTPYLPLYVNHGYCTDVMEHIPPELVDITIDNVMAACEDCFFQISTIPDSLGGLVGQDLHLSVHPHEWWKRKFTSLGYAVLWEEETPITALFHISSTGDQ